MQFRSTDLLDAAPLSRRAGPQPCGSVVENAGEEPTYFHLVFGRNKGVIQLRG
jgi:hypothetical protein